jgi:hypothetical protein
MNNDNTPNSPNTPVRNRRGSSPPFQESGRDGTEQSNTNGKPEGTSFDQIKLQQARGDETRWQDDGGESGEVV